MKNYILPIMHVFEVEPKQVSAYAEFPINLSWASSMIPGQDARYIIQKKALLYDLVALPIDNQPEKNKHFYTKLPEYHEFWEEKYPMFNMHTDYSAVLQ